MRSNSEYYNNGTIPWLKTGEIKQEFIYQTQEFITEKGLSNSSAKMIPRNSIIIAMYGDGNTAGHAAVNKIDLCTNQACCNLIPDNSKVYYLYLYYFFKANYEHLVGLKLGGSQQNLNATTIKNLDISLPPLPTQKKIAAVLSAYDDLIENNTRRIALLEDMAEELYKEWFVRMRFPGHKSVRFEKGIPEGWRIDIIDSVSKKIVTGKTPPTKISSYYNGDIHFIKTPDMHGNLFILDTQEKVTIDGLNSNKSQIIPANSICVSCIGTGGVVSITTENCQTNQQINSVLPKNSFYLEWLYQTIKNQKETIALFGGTGTTMTNLSKGKFSKIKIFVPTEDLILQYHQQINSIFEKHKILSKQINNLKTTRDRLLTRLISGKLSVKDLDIAFPPSMENPLDE